MKDSKTINSPLPVRLLLDYWPPLFFNVVTPVPNRPFPHDPVHAYILCQPPCGNDPTMSKTSVDIILFPVSILYLVRGRDVILVGCLPAGADCCGRRAAGDRFACRERRAECGKVALRCDVKCDLQCDSLVVDSVSS